ncbi:MAG: hypothetical protein C0173_04330 [Desulfurella sp.]|jgi:cell division protein FtsW|nr:FtsW/RodA/SpoVE family cell cycle protein [Desulfurella sp.]PMP90556.1 MAG: hypothetical protein C0173_04330 [Desulfurella sp.]HEX13448.1 hypothetical protein [Desulfurella acetivorans]
MTKHRAFEPTIIIFCTFILVFIGLVETWSASNYFFFQHFGKPNFLLERYLIYIVVSFFVGLFFYKINPQKLRQLIPLFLSSAIVFLIALHLGFGVNIRGAVRWFNFGFFSFEPTEFARFAFILYLADFIDRKYESLNDLNVISPLFLVFGIIALLIISQPDIGGAFLFCLVVLLVLYIFGLRTSYIGIILALGVIVFSLVFLVHPERLQRLSSFIHNNHLPYQVHQGFIALAGGGLFGRGIGNGSFKSLFLPDAYNDFIIASIGEDLGFLGVLLVIILLFLLIYSIFSIANKLNNYYEKAFVFGTGFLFSIQILINLFSVFHLIPTKGTVLPFVSYGGSSLVVNAMFIGVVLGLSRKL